MTALILLLAASVQVFRQVPSQLIRAPGDVVAGRPFTLECKITRPTNDTSDLTWYHFGQTIFRVYLTSVCNSSIPVSPSSPAGLSGECQHVNGEEVYTVTIENVTEEMSMGRWFCRYGRERDYVFLDVKVMVTRVTLTNPPDAVLAGSPGNFTCVTSASKPQACIRGYIRGPGNVRELEPPANCSQNSSSVQTTMQTLTFSASAEENGAELYCNASNSVTDAPVTSQLYRLDVHYPPQSDVLLSGYVNNTAVEVGETLTLTCQVEKGNPRPALSWSSGCSQTSTVPGHDGSQQINISITVSPSLNQKTCVCKASQDGALTGWTGQESRTFNVTFGPGSVRLRADSGQSGNTVTVKENSTVTCTCTIGESNPAAFLSWFNNSSPIAAAELSDVSSQRGPNHGYLTTQRYTVRVDRSQDGDVIRCEAQRPGNRNSKRVSQNLTLSVTYIPRVVCSRTDLTVFEGQRIELSCDVMSKPEATVTWLKDGGQVDGVSWRTSKQRDVIVATLQVDVHSDTSPGIYEIVAANAVGTTKETIKITMKEGQLLPEQIYLDSNSCTNNQVTLFWASDIDDSVMAYYKLEYKGNQDVWQGELVRNPGRGKLVMTTLKDLQSEVFYQFRLRPASDFLVPFFMTKNCTVKGFQSGLSKFGMLGLGIAVGVCLVALLGAVVTCLLLHSRKLTWTKPDPEKYSHQTADTTGNSSEDPPLGQYGDLNTRPISGAKYEELSVRPTLPVTAEKAVYVNATVM